MCLKNATLIIEPEERCGEGWKVFVHNAGEHCLFPPYYGKERPMTPNEWLNERHWRENWETPPETYDPGWHLFLLKADADVLARRLNDYHPSWLAVVRRVKYRGARLLGVQPNLPPPPRAALAAEEIFILPEDADVS